MEGSIVGSFENMQESGELAMKLQYMQHIAEMSCCELTSLQALHNFIASTGGFSENACENVLRALSNCGIARGKLRLGRHLKKLFRIDAAHEWVKAENRHLLALYALSERSDINMDWLIYAKECYYIDAGRFGQKIVAASDKRGIIIDANDYVVEKLFYVKHGFTENKSVGACRIPMDSVYPDYDRVVTECYKTYNVLNLLKNCERKAQFRMPVCTDGDALQKNWHERWILDSEHIGMSGDGSQFYDIDVDGGIKLSRRKPCYTALSDVARLPVETDVAYTLMVCGALRNEVRTDLKGNRTITASALSWINNIQNVNLAYMSHRFGAYIIVSELDVCRTYGCSKFSKDGSGKLPYKIAFVRLFGHVYLGYLCNTYFVPIMREYGKAFYNSYNCFIAQSLLSEYNTKEMMELRNTAMTLYEKSKGMQSVEIGLMDFSQYLLSKFIAL